MSSKDPKNKFLAFFQDGKFPKFTRISLDIVWNVLLFFLVIGLVGAFVVGGIGLGYFGSLVDDMPVEDEEEMKNLIFDYEETSHIYFADNVYMGELRSDLRREEITLDDVSQHLVDAVISTEDELFYEHNGFVPKAIMRAVLQEFTNADTQTGGSTLTQQIIKNQVLSSEVSFKRKAQEILMAARVEKFIEKDDILLAYLNIVPFGRDSSGRNIAGVQAAAEGLFDVNADELNVAQAAYIAGLPQNPYVYTPFLQGGELKSEEALQSGLDRKNIVLSRMLDTGAITEEEYNEARDFDVIGSLTDKKESLVTEYPYLTFEIEERAIEKLALQLAKNDGYSEEEFYADEEQETRVEYRDQAERDLRQKGYQIHTTIDKEIYDVWQDVTENYGHFYPDKTVNVTNPETGETEERTIEIETGATMVENSTGRIISFVGGRGYQDDNINYAFFNTRPNGSTMKPLLGYAPAMELGLVQPGTPLPDVKFQMGDWTPSNYSVNSEKGIVSAREALAKSYNLPAARLMQGMLQVDNNPARYLVDLGMADSIEQVQTENVAPAILGTYFSTVEENTVGFASFANGGEKVEPYMIEKITDEEGNVVFEHEVKSTKVYSPQTAYLTIDMLRDVINNGTATYIKSRLNNPSVDWAGKTGTSQNFFDAWFVGTNPNVTVGSWIGYGQYDLDGKGGEPSDYEKTMMSLNYCPQGNCSLSYSQRNTGFWSELVNAAAEIDPELVTPSSRHESPGGIVQRSYCLLSGKLPSEACSALGLVQTDLFNIEHVPTERDDSVIEGRYVEIGDNIYEAEESTPEEFTEEGFFIRPDFLEDMGGAWFQIDDLSKLLPDNDAWNDLVVPETDPPSTGAPGTPSGVSMSGSTLSWNESSNAIGYYVYMASEEDGDFRQVEATTETSISVPSNNRVYGVRAVNFFGEESSMSNTVIRGSISSDEDEDEDEDEDRDRRGRGDDDGSNGDSDDDREPDQETGGNGEDNSDNDENNDEEEDTEPEDEEDDEGENDGEDEEDEEEEDDNNEDGSTSSLPTNHLIANLNNYNKQTA